eukprot:1178095-Prorocentrum_minimum.AAC.2
MVYRALARGRGIFRRKLEKCIISAFSSGQFSSIRGESPIRPDRGASQYYIMMIVNVIDCYFSLLSGDGANVLRGLYGNVLVIGAWHDDDQASNAGAAYVYEWLGSSVGWSLVQGGHLLASDGDVEDRFGERIAFNGKHLAVAAAGDDDMGNKAGAMYMFTISSPPPPPLPPQAPIPGTYGPTTLSGVTAFYGSSCANNGKGALNTPETLPLFLTLCPAPHFLPLLSPFGPC